MSKYKNITTLFFLACLFILLNSVSAADYYVNNDTTHKDITEWMNKNAKTGDNLIFNTTSYDLSDNLNITKSINVKSNMNTSINFNKVYPDGTSIIFDITAKNVLISGLTLNQNEDSNLSYVSGITISGSYNSYVDIKNTNINTNLSWSSAITIAKGNIVNCTINSKSYGIIVDCWKGSIVNSKINAEEEGISDQGYNLGSRKCWYGDMLNTIIISKKAVKLQEWKGKMINSTIQAKYNGIDIKYSEGLINKSIIISKNSYAVKVASAVKIVNSSFSSQKGLLKVYRYLADIKIDEISQSGRTYRIVISNIGYSISKPTQIGLKVGKIVKKAYVKPIKPHSLYQTAISKTKYETIIKITILKKYINKKYLKTFKLDYYNKNREISKKNNILKFRSFPLP